MLKRIGDLSPARRGILIVSSILLTALLIAGACLAAYAVRAYYIKTSGIWLKPSRDFEVHSVRYYLQNDPEWGGDMIGRSGSRVAGAGCLVTCAASAVTDLGEPVTPGEFNKKLTEVDGFQGDSLIWYKINEAFPEINYKYTRTFSRATIEDDLKAGLLPIICVKYRGHGITHWLLVVGAKDGDFLVYDPLNADMEPMPLATHGKVYSYRVLIHL